MKIVINDKFGGFGLSHKAVMRYAEIKGIKLYPWLDETTFKYCPDNNFDNALLVHYSTVPKEEYDKFSKLWSATAIEDRVNLGNGGYFSSCDIERTDPALIQLIEEMGDLANGHCAALKIIKIPDGTDWQIEEYDGTEWIAEKHRTWNK